MNIIIKVYNFTIKNYKDCQIDIDDTLPPARSLVAPLTSPDGAGIERMIFLSPKRVVTRRSYAGEPSFMGSIEFQTLPLEIHSHYILGEGMIVQQYSDGMRNCLGSRILIASRIETAGEENTVSVHDSGLRLTLAGDWKSLGFSGFEDYERLLEMDLLTEADINRVRAVQTRLSTLVDKSRTSSLIKPSFI